MYVYMYACMYVSMNVYYTCMYACMYMYVDVDEPVTSKILITYIEGEIL